MVTRYEVHHESNYGINSTVVLSDSEESAYEYVKEFGIGLSKDGILYASKITKVEPVFLHIKPPDWTVPQMMAVELKFRTNPDGSPDLPSFVGRWQEYYGGYIGAGWCGMFVGIEKDGYSHT